DSDVDEEEDEDNPVDHVLTGSHDSQVSKHWPNTNLEALDEVSKRAIIEDIEADFKKGYQGILQLPTEAKFGVFMAYRYYKCLLRKLYRTPAVDIKNTRIRVPNYQKFGVLTRSYVKYQLNLVR
ncbi:MAG: hypothetical protein AAF466_14270, partial [Bacteroidota bacterium]